jgi:hypothetical protein
MEPKKYTNHIKLLQGQNECLEIHFDDYELTDFIEDILVEKYNIEIESIRCIEEKKWIIVLSKTYSFDSVDHILSGIGSNKINEIWDINNA